MTKQEIITASGEMFTEFGAYCRKMDERAFFEQPGNKWSVAQNVQHLVVSTNTSTLAWQLPGIVIRLWAGKPNRPSRSFEALQEKYTLKLSEGGRASGRFVPKAILPEYGKEKLLNEWDNSGTKYLQLLNSRRSETDLDNYLIPHPLLGRITLRELCYFSIFHTRHHLEGLKKMSTAHDPVL